jgi:restriction system protein
MSVPHFQEIMLPLLRELSNGKIHTTRELIESLSDSMKLTDEDRKELLPSGQQPLFDNRVGWARTYLKKAGLVESDKRGTQKITQKGLDILKDSPKEINVQFLERFPEFLEFLYSNKNSTAKKTDIQKDDSFGETPEEQLESSYVSIRTDLAQELLQKIKSSSPQFFEQIVVDVVVAMGYGGSRYDAGKAVGRSGDGGIDGIIKEDKLGLDTIYLQAKRWDAPVPVKEVRDFTGALLAKGARKGVFVTTSQFSKDAYEHANSIRELKIVLIDGSTLVNMMIDLGVGVSIQKTYKISKIDSDYFEE